MGRHVFYPRANFQLNRPTTTEDTDGFGTAEQIRNRRAKVRVYEQKKLSFEGNDLKFGMVARIHAFYPRANFQVNRPTTTEDTDGFGTAEQNSEQASKML